LQIMKRADHRVINPEMLGDGSPDDVVEVIVHGPLDSLRCRWLDAVLYV